MSREQFRSSFDREAEEPLRPGEEVDLQINLRLRLDEVAAIEATALRTRPRKEPGQKELKRLACRIYDARRAREKIFDGKLLGEPGWDMLLALYCLPWRGEVLTVTSLGLAANLAQATGLRWQAILMQHDLIKRGPSQDGDGRRILVGLTDTGRTLMERYLTKLYFCEYPNGPE